MRRFIFTLLLPLFLLLAGCGMMQNNDFGVPQSTDAGDAALSENKAYSSNTSAKDCILCGGGMEKLLPSKWGQNNIALISLNTFEFQSIGINRYEGGQLIEKFAGYASIECGGSKGDGFSASLMENHDRGYATGSVYFHDDETLDIDKAAGFLCESCLNEILPTQTDRCFGVGAIDLATGKICIFAENVSGFVLGDFYIDCDLQSQDGNRSRMDLLIFYCPIRYEKEP